MPPLQAQRAEVDSLLLQVKPPKDTAYVSRLLAVAYAYRVINLDSMRHYVEEGSGLAHKLGFKVGVVRGLHLQAVHAAISGLRDSALVLWDSALVLVRQLPQQQQHLEANILNGLGAAHFQESNYTQAATYLRAALRIHVRTNNPEGLFTVYNNLTNLYYELGAFTESLETSQLALKAARDLKDKRREGLIESNRGNLFNKLGQVDQAREAYILSLSLLKDVGSYGQQASAWLGLANTFAQLNQFPQADSSIQQAYDLFKKTGEIPGIIQSLIVQGDFSHAQKKYADADRLYRAALEQAESTGIPRLRNNVYTSKSRLALDQNNLEEASRLLNLQQRLADSIRNPEFRADGLELQAQLRHLQGRHAEAFSLLRTSIALKDSINADDQGKKVLNVEAAYRLSRQEEELARIEENQRQALVRQQYIWGLVAAIVLLVGGLGFFFQYRQYRKARERELATRAEMLNRQVAEQTAEITAQSEELQQANHELEATLFHLKETQQQLIHSEKMASLGQLTAGIAHEINNPINFISSNVVPLRQNVAQLQLLLESCEALVREMGNPEAQARFTELRSVFEADETTQELRLLLEGITTGANRTAEIVRGLRNFSRLDESEYKPADVQEILDSTLLLIHGDFKDRITVERRYGDVPPLVCYPGQLGQLFLNLLINAFQAIRETGSITVRTWQETVRGKPYVLVSVSDTGGGIPPELKSRIFEPFFTTKKVGEGTGLGLSIAHAIVERHSGKIRVDSTEGIGTTFTVSLPWKDTDTE